MERKHLFAFLEQKKTLRRGEAILLPRRSPGCPQGRFGPSTGCNIGRTGSPVFSQEMRENLGKMSGLPSQPRFLTIGLQALVSQLDTCEGARRDHGSLRVRNLGLFPGVYIFPNETSEVHNLTLTRPGPLQGCPKPEEKWTFQREISDGRF